MSEPIALADVPALVGITYRQADYWTRTGDLIDAGMLPTPAVALARRLLIDPDHAIRIGDLELRQVAPA